MDNWQPIETAPKDGTEIDVWATNADRHSRRIPDVKWDRMTTWDGRDYDGWTGMFPTRFCAEYVPTHWMPVPRAPVVYQNAVSEQQK